MKKRFDVKGTLSLPARELTPEHIEMATRQVHEKKDAEKAEKAAEKPAESVATAAPKPQKAEAEKEKTVREPRAVSAKKAETKAVLPAISMLLPVLPPRSERMPEPQRRVLGRIGRRIVTDDPMKKVRLSIDVRPEVHKKLKIKAIENDSDIMRYVERLIERDLGLAGE